MLSHIVLFLSTCSLRPSSYLRKVRHHHTHRLSLETVNRNNPVYIFEACMCTRAHVTVDQRYMDGGKGARDKKKTTTRETHPTQSTFTIYVYIKEIVEDSRCARLNISFFVLFKYNMCQDMRSSSYECLNVVFTLFFLCTHSLYSLCTRIYWEKKKKNTNKKKKSHGRVKRAYVFVVVATVRLSFTLVGKYILWMYINNIESCKAKTSVQIEYKLRKLSPSNSIDMVKTTTTTPSSQAIGAHTHTPKTDKRQNDMWKNLSAYKKKTTKIIIRTINKKKPLQSNTTTKRDRVRIE